MAQQFAGLIADVGGTNIRLALVEKSQVNYIEIRKYLCTQFPTIAHVIQHYLKEIGVSVKRACIAIACPTHDDLIDMTNNSWSFSQRELQQELELDELYVINDYTAISMSLPFIPSEKLIQIGAGQVQSSAPKAVLGPGTGLGVAHLVHINDKWHSLPGEGGHVDFSPVDELDVAIWHFLRKRYEHISYEQLLSGLGIEQIYEAICSLSEGDFSELSAAEISAKGVAGECPVCTKAMSQFCKILGSHAGNLALNLAAFGGVYVAGGIVPRFTDFVATSGFRERFEDKGRFQDYVRKIPSFLITEEQPGLIGAAAYLMQQES